MWGPSGRPTEGCAGRLAALLLAVTLRLRFQSSEGPLGSQGPSVLFCRWGLGGVPSDTPCSLWYQALAPARLHLLPVWIPWGGVYGVGLPWGGPSGHGSPGLSTRARPEPGFPAGAGVGA